MKFRQILKIASMVAASLWLTHGGGVQAQDGVSKTSIAIGQSAALTGPAAPLAMAFTGGARLYFDRVNAAGGVNGRKLELVSLDDTGNPASTAANTKKLLDQGVLLLFGYYGSPQVTAAYPVVKDSDVVMLAPMAGADEFRSALYPSIYHLRPGYSEEAVAITRHAETLGARKLAVLHAKDSESLAALDSAERTMTSLGANLIIKVGIDAVDKAVAVKPESALIIGDTKGAASAIRELRKQGFRGPIYGFSNTGESLLAEQLGAAGAGVVVARVVPKSDNAKLPVVRELQADALAANAGKPNVYMLEGYLAARVLVEALRRIPGKDAAPNRARLRKALDGMDDLNMGGFRIHFAEDRVGSRLVELGLIDSQGRVRE